MARLTKEEKDKVKRIKKSFQGVSKSQRRLKRAQRFGKIVDMVVG